jgi:Asp/Glu/hydantoin racemase
MPTLAFIHTVAGLAERFRELARTALPDWTSYAIVDESLLGQTIRSRSLSPETQHRLARYALSAVDAGADAIVVTCSTLGGAVDEIRPVIPVPLFRIDRGMAEAAVRKARRIGVLATLPTTMESTTTLLIDAAAEAGADCQIVGMLCEGAFDKLLAGNRAGHDADVCERFVALSSTVDLVVLAQASMADSLSANRLNTAIPFLSSPELGMAHVARSLHAR